MNTTEIFQAVGNKTNGLGPKFTDPEMISLENKRLLVEIRGLQQTNRDYKSIIHYFSHDLDWPLNNIVSLINLMVDTKDPEEFVALSKTVLKSLRKFKISMNELLKFNAQKNELEKRGIINVKNLLHEVIESLNGQYVPGGMVLTQALQTTHIKLPKKKLRSILYNLISNAIKFKSANKISAIHVSTYRKEHFVVLSVMDNGTGIPSHKMDKLFTKFGTLHDESYPGESLGMGLFLLKNIVEETGGKIEAESIWGKGSIFKVYLNQDAYQKVD
ncbi:MAG: HAMP domain-containing sensor histidine kinase [Cyclobacteriaceae bacterium]